MKSELMRKMDALVPDGLSIILLEGTRKVPSADAPALRAFAAELARRYPHALFRTGNASGSDELFAEGIASVDPSRLQYVLPYAGHRKSKLNPVSYAIALSDLSGVHEEDVAWHTKQATPKNERVIDKRNEVPQLKSKARYLMRDTLKVLGSTEHELAPATLGIFYVNPADPEGGGTGHTIRVCRQHHVPVFTQNDWI